MKKTSLLVLLCIATITLFAWDGDGTVSNPYKISTPQDLVDLTQPYESFTGLYFLQTQDIDMQEIEGFKPIGRSGSGFKGFYDGQNHQIKNLKISIPTESRIGLFSVASVGSIERVHITGDSRFEGYGYVGSIVGECDNTVIRYCSSSAAVVGSGENIGGIAGKGHEISNCNFLGTVFSDGTYSSNVGGIAGAISSVITNCINSGTIQGRKNVGGICGNFFDGEMFECYNIGSVTGIGDYTGGIVGFIPLGLISSATLKNCHNSGDVKGVNYVGGIAGSASPTIRITGNIGNVEGTGNYVGGIAGYGSAEQSYNKGAVSGVEYVGGIMGTVGNMDNCYNTGTVTGTDYVGGLVGAANGTSNEIENSYSTGNISSSGAKVGGVVGYMNTGGLVNSNSIVNSYWNSDIYAGKGVGNLENPTTSFAFYPKTSAELKNNFSSTLGVTWEEDTKNVNNGYPVLIGEIHYNSIQNYPSELAKVSVYSSGNQIYINNNAQIAIKQVQIFDISGRSVYHNIPTRNEEAITLNVSSGIYIVTLATAKEVKGYKIMLIR